MEPYIAEQETLIRLIKNSVTNYNKTAKAKRTVGVIKSRIAILQGHWDKCVSLNAKIESEATDEDTQESYFMDGAFEQAEAYYLTAMDHMQGELEITMADLQPGPPQSASTSKQPAGNIVTQVSVAEISEFTRLPQIEIPKFTGSYTEWANFRDLFESIVVKNSRLSKVQKLHYLKTNVSGEAFNLLKNVTITEANFDSAWTSLCNQYDNQRAIINAHLRAFYSISSVCNNSLSELKGLRDQAHDVLTALKNLGRSTANWDDLIVFQLVEKLDQQSRQLWETKLGDNSDYPTYEELKTFLNTRIRALEAINVATSVCHESDCPVKGSKSKSYKTHHNAWSPRCTFCAEGHSAAQCETFRGKSLADRTAAAREAKCCFNCLKKGHLPRECQSKFNCNKCHKRHHTLLHDNKYSNNHQSNNANVQSAHKADSQSNGNEPSNSQTSKPQSAPVSNKVKTAPQETSESSSYATLLCSKSDTKVLLATAWVQIKSSSGRAIRVRALLDHSEASFVTESVVQTLRASRQHVSASISGLGGQQSATSRSMASLEVEPCHYNGPSIPIQAIVLQQLTTYRPSTIKRERWSHLQGIQLADAVDSSEPINLLIGADLYGSILLDGLRKGHPSEPIAQNTIFGWILSGPTHSPEPGSIRVNNLHCEVLHELNASLRQFFDSEEPPKVRFLTKDEEKCEKHFSSTHSRNSQGQYIVRLPFRSEPPIDIGSSYVAAISAYCKLERRLATQPELQQSYNAFLAEYLQLGHMSQLNSDELGEKQRVYLTHHPIVREESSTTKLRVVFNASQQSSNGTSLNDHLLVGPKLQADIVALILQWRMHRYVIAADIAKMFRQIWVDERDRDYQLILWRPGHEQEINTYRLNTVTYGAAPSPYLANRVIKQLVQDEGKNYPLAIPILENNIYVDDVLFGAEDVVIARQMRDQVTRLLAQGGFHLRKFASNCPRLIDDLDPNSHEVASDKLFQESEQLKMLGIYWTPLHDEFRFRLNVPVTAHLTKRVILSTIAKIYDPLGWISPFIINAKIFMQKLWLEPLDWHDPLPTHLLEQWNNFYTQLPRLANVAIPRWVGLDNSVFKCELHGFADASNLAYAAVVYLRIEKLHGETEVHMLLAKTKVAPLRPSSIPRLELLATALLANLISQVREILKLPEVAIFCWTDSTVALAWIRKHPSNWKVFVANRVAEIQSLTSDATWSHVPTESNPADCASRGISVVDLISKRSWWTGPEWLRLPPEAWPASAALAANTPELETKVNALALNANINPEWEVLDRYASWTKLLRVTAYVFRFIENCQGRLNETPDLALSNKEVQKAKSFWIKYVQNIHFKRERADLEQARPLSKKDPLLSLNPFLDESGIIRVGGRLRNAAITYPEQCPVILPKHKISELIIADCHKNTLHAGTQLMLRVLRRTFWIIRARDLVKNHIHNCVTCVRARARTCNQLMGDLPKVRVTPARPFAHSGIDYAGPLMVRFHSGRGHKAHKAYIAVFVCLSVRATHLEVVSDYSTDAFLAAFRRFAARRGNPTVMYSDNGTNFRGADRELKRAFEQVTQDVELRNVLASDGTEWCFIPPNAPHFGGLWEVGVKSVKLHLKKIIGTHTPSLEELNTLLCQIEACLNSRPLSPLNNDPENFDALTPGHFLVGGSLKTPPAPTLLHLNENRLSRWQLMSQKLERFWRIWSTEYFQSLQKRIKWSSVQENLKPGDLVLLKNSLLPPSKWALGRIVECHAGKDKHVRVIKIKTATSEFLRPITQVCKLPVNSEP